MTKKRVIYYKRRCRVVGQFFRSTFDRCGQFFVTFPTRALAWRRVGRLPSFLPSFPSPLCPRATTRQTFDLGNGFPCRHNRMRPPWRSLLVTELKSDQDIDVNGRRNFDSGPKFVVVCTKVRGKWCADC